MAAIAAVVLASGCGGADGAPDALAPEPTAGDWRSWVIESGAEVDVPPPPRHGSKAARQDADELRSVVASRSSRDEDRARALDREPAVEPWLRDVMGFVAARPKDPVRASRNYALVSVAMHDAAIAAWHWKYEYDREAPNEDALFDPAGDPSYPSEHAAIAGAASRVLAELYPNEPAARLERRSTRPQAGGGVAARVDGSPALPALGVDRADGHAAGRTSR